MEGGGVVLFKNQDNIIDEEVLVSQEDIERLEDLDHALRGRFGDILTFDSFGRKTDRAIDLEAMDKEKKSLVENFLSDHQASFSTSSVHVNFWYGDVSKYQGIQWVLKKKFPHVAENECLYFGDAINDESVFKGLENTVGVSNVSRCLDKMKDHPRVILEGKDNEAVYGVFNFLKQLK